jgi:predicted MFS family arabinose efflux permease
MIFFSLSNALIIALIFLVIYEIAEAASDVFHDAALHHEFSSKIRASLGSFNSIVWAIANSVAVFLAGLSITFLGLTITIIFSGAFAILASLVFLFGLKEKNKK